MGLQTTSFTILLLVAIVLLILTFYGHPDVEEEGYSTKCFGCVILVYPIAGMLMYAMHAKQGIGKM